MMGITFLAPWVLTVLVGLPILWIILRSVPPRPKTHFFAAVTLLQGIKDRETSAAKTPWWFIVLRMVAVVALIVAIAGPRIHHDENRAVSDNVLIVIDGGWASAPNAQMARSFAINRVRAAFGDGRRFAVLNIVEPGAIVWQIAQDVDAILNEWQPRPWAPNWESAAHVVTDLVEKQFDTIWLSDGISYAGARDPLLTNFEMAGQVSIFEPNANLIVIQDVSVENGETRVRLKSMGPTIQDGILRLHGVDPALKPIVIQDFTFPAFDGAGEYDVTFRAPNELMSRVTKFEIVGQSHIGANFAVADQLRRPKIAIMKSSAGSETLDVLDPLHYVETAVQTIGEVQIGTVPEMLLMSPDVMISADVVGIAHQNEVLDWVKSGGTLMRFAGPRMAAAAEDELFYDPLMPVKLRHGGRDLGGAMSWDKPKAVDEFARNSVFAGLTIPSDLRIKTQVLAQPDPDLAGQTLSSLEDKTPLVTSKTIGAGRVVLFHVTANAEWSNLPLSGLFVEMLTRVIRPNMAPQDIALIDGLTWTPVFAMDAFGGLKAVDDLGAVSGKQIASASIMRDVPIGVYRAGDYTIARNLGSVIDVPSPMKWPSTVSVYSDTDRQSDIDLRALFLLIGFSIFFVDIFASLWVSGRLNAATMIIAIAVLILNPHPSKADQTVPDEFALAHIITGDRDVDNLAHAGMIGLSDTLFQRTSIEPSSPVGVDLERDEISLYSLLYWPITTKQPRPSVEAYAKLNTFFTSGGVILFDTRDAGQGRTSTNNAALRELLSPLVIPPLEIVPDDHVLTRAFYLLQSFPGRFSNGPIWIETSTTKSGQSDEQPFRDLNDGVTPVLIGGNDWAAAWAVDDLGRPLVPIGRGFAGEQQREMARRFGVNLVMHVLMGNYKSDQVHVPALLERLGQ